MKQIGTLTSDGDAPGMNATIRAVTRTALTSGIEVCGIRYGYAGLVAGDIFQMTSRTVASKINRGDTFLYSARFPEFKEKEVRLKGIRQLKKHGVDALVIIGGDGSYRGALKLTRHGYNAIDLPGSVDNDISYTDFTIDFDTACNTAMEAIDRIRDTATSHQRASVVNVMGHDCGDIAMHVGAATGAGAIVIPEKPYDIGEIAESLEQEFANGKKHGIVVLAEGVMGVNKFKDKLLKYGDLDTRASILGHMQHGENPTTRDRVLAGEVGAYAVRLLLEGKGGLAVGIENNRLSHHDILGLFDARHYGNYALYSLNKDLTK